MHVASIKFHILTVASLLADMAKSGFLINYTLKTSDSCPDKILTAVGSSVFHILIKQSADQIAQSAPCTNLQCVIKTLYVSGFIDCAYKGELISKSDYEEFKAQVLELQQC